MNGKATHTKIRTAICNLVVITWLLTSTLPIFAQPSPAFNADYPVYDMTPSTGAPGRDYAVRVLSHDPARKEITDKTQLVPLDSLTVSGVKNDSNASLSAKISIPRDAPIGKYRFLLKDEDTANILGVADFEVTAIGQGATPPGIDPQVDVMWGVMPSKIVSHNFGRQIANNYYGIQIRIGNDSGYDLQLAGIGFKLRDSGLSNIVPTNSYRSTRGTLEKEQQIGIRASVVNAVKALGTLYSGFLPFWHMPNRKANANLAGEILNGPFERGLEIVFPDLTTAQLTRLDDQTLRDGLIVKNNSQIVTLVWIAKKTLNLSNHTGPEEQAYLNRLIPDPSNLNNKIPATQRSDVKNWRDDPQYVNWKLGEMVLVGQQITYINRVQVISTTEGSPVTPPPSVTGLNIQSAKQGEQGKEIVFSGDFLIAPSIAGPTGIEFPSSNITVDKNSHIVRAKMNVSETIEPGTYNLTVTTEGGQKVVAFRIDPAPPKIDAIAPLSIKPTDKDQDVKVTITGKFLKGGKLTLKKVENVLEVKDDATGDATKITQTIKVFTKAAAGDQTLEFTAPGGTTTVLIKIAAPQSPK